jgi:hypothetical protein
MGRARPTPRGPPGGGPAGGCTHAPKVRYSCRMPKNRASSSPAVRDKYHHSDEKHSSMMAGSWVSLTLLLAAFALGPLVVYVFKGQHEEAASSAEGSSNPWLTMGPQGYLEEVALSLALLGLVYVFYLLSRAVTALIHFLEMLFVGAVLLGWCIACFWCAWGGRSTRVCARGEAPHPASPPFSPLPRSPAATHLRKNPQGLARRATCQQCA